MKEFITPKSIDWNDYYSICLNDPSVDVKVKFGSQLNKVSEYCGCVYRLGFDQWGIAEFNNQVNRVKNGSITPEFQTILKVCGKNK